MNKSNDVMLVDDEVCSRVAGVYNSPRQIVDISPVSTVRWLEVSRTFNSTVSKSRVCARSATCCMNKSNDVMLVDDEVCSRVAGVYNSPRQIVDISPVSTVRWLEVSRTFSSTVNKSRVCGCSAPCRMDRTIDVMLLHNEVCR
jgi:hypothetical protein